MDDVVGERRHHAMSMADVAKLLGFVNVASGEVDVASKRRAVRRLKAAERRTGEVILMGGGAPGANYWTTLAQLRQAFPGLRYDGVELDRFRHRVGNIEAELGELREAVAILAKQLAALQRSHARER